MALLYASVRSDESNALPAMLAWIRSLILQNVRWEMLLLLEIWAGFVCFLVCNLRSLLPPFAYQRGVGGFAKRLLISYRTYPYLSPCSYRGVLLRGWKGPGQAFRSPGWTGDGLSPAGLLRTSCTAWGGQAISLYNSHPLVSLGCGRAYTAIWA